MICLTDQGSKVDMSTRNSVMSNKLFRPHLCQPFFFHFRCSLPFRTLLLPLPFPLLLLLLVLLGPTFPIPLLLPIGFLLPFPLLLLLPPPLLFCSPFASPPGGRDRSFSLSVDQMSQTLRALSLAYFLTMLSLSAEGLVRLVAFSLELDLLLVWSPLSVDKGVSINGSISERHDKFAREFMRWQRSHDRQFL